MTDRLVGLVLRVLYRLRTLSEQATFDAATFSYASPLFTQVLTRGGVSVEGDDDPGEQIILVLEVISFHAAECEFIILDASSIARGIVIEA
jgi:hypothetical protein